MNGLYNPKELTISNPIFFDGICVHSGKKSKVSLFPSEPKNGIDFYKNNIHIPLDIKFIDSNLPLCTKITKDNISIGTIEHLLSAVYALGISNLKIVVEGDEIPILDGSSKQFVEAIFPHLIEQNSDRLFLELKEEIHYKNNDKFIIAIPSDQLEVYYFLDYENKLPSFTYELFTYSIENYIKNISSARTFGFLSDVKYLHEKNLALGANYDNSIIITESSYSSELRYKNEMAKHKVLDLLGDISFLQKSLKAKIIAYKTGHFDHLQLVKKIISN